MTDNAKPPQLCDDPTCGIPVRHPASHPGLFKQSMYPIVESVRDQIRVAQARNDADRLSEEDEPIIETNYGEPAERKRYAGVDVANVSTSEKERLFTGGIRIDKTPSERTRQVFAETMRRETDGAIAEAAREVHGISAAEVALVADLKTAAVNLRDAELALKAARENYAEKLGAFNRFVAPVPG